MLSGDFTVLSSIMPDRFIKHSIWAFPVTQELIISTDVRRGTVFTYCKPETLLFDRQVMGTTIKGK
jgi:hypothetical protein